MKDVAKDAPKEHLAGCPRRGDVDCRVPEPHEGKHNAGGVGEWNGNTVRVNEGVNTVDG